MNDLDENNAPSSSQILFKELFKLYEQLIIEDYLSDIHTVYSYFLHLYQNNYINFNLITLNIDNNLQQTIENLKENKIHRIIIEDTKVNSFTGFITYENVFEYFIDNYYSEKMDVFETDINNLNLIRKDLIYIDKSDSIIKTLETMFDNKISTIPILNKENENNNLYGFFYLKDIIYLFNNDDKFSVILYFKDKLVY